MRVIQPVTSLRCFGRGKMAAGQLRTAEKAVFAYRMRKKKRLAVFPSKVQTLLLSKNLTCENFVSVALKV